MGTALATDSWPEGSGRPTGDGEETDLPFEAFGEVFLREVLHTRRVLESIDRILGEEFHLGPMGAGPGRRVARLTAHGAFRSCTGEQLPGPPLRYRVVVPVDVTFDLQLPLDTQRFRAEVLVPLGVTLRVVEPLTIVWDITPPTEDEVQISVTGEKRRSVLLQKAAGFDGEIRRFLVRFVHRELQKPHVRKACRIPVIDVIDGAWPQIAAQFLPNGPEDRG